MDGAKIKQMRQERGLARRAVAFGTDLTESTILAIESNKTNPTLTTLEKIAAFFDVPVSELLIQ